MKRKPYEPRKNGQAIRELNVCRNIRTIIGTTEIANPKAIFIQFRGWSTIRKGMGNEDLEKVVKRLNKTIRIFLYNNLDNNVFYNQKYITDLDYPTTVMYEDKPTFVTLEITINQRGKINFHDRKIQGELLKLIEGLDVMFKHDKVFRYSKTKAKALEVLQYV